MIQINLRNFFQNKLSEVRKTCKEFFRGTDIGKKRAERESFKLQKTLDIGTSEIPNLTKKHIKND